MEAIARDCLELAESYRLTDVGTASEAELERQMREASLNDDLCARALQDSYRGPGGEVMAHHLARSMAIHSLYAELALAERFDEMAGYCEILEDLVALLREDLAELDGAFERAEDLPEEDIRALLPLRELTVQSLQVCLLDFAQTCRPGRWAPRRSHR